MTEDGDAQAQEAGGPRLDGKEGKSLSPLPDLSPSLWNSLPSL